MSATFMTPFFFLDPSSQGAGMTPFPNLSNYNVRAVMELCNRHSLT
ncbi:MULTISPECIES: hypothetical protein [unclassified Wolbachia]|nr:hypothetical protein [Wolbachia endosymbiont (group A) of Apoderus coryli]